MRRIVTVAAATLLALGTMAGPALAKHPHHMEHPGGCSDVPVGHQAHGEDEPGNKFHGGAHVGAATEEDDDGDQRLGQGNSQVTVHGGECD